MRFLVFNNESGLGAAKELIINWESIKYIKPDTASKFDIFLNNGSSMEFQVNAGNSSDIIEAINTAIKSRSNSNRVIPIQQKSIGAFSFISVSAPVAPISGLTGVTNSSTDTPSSKTALGVGAGGSSETATNNTWIGFDAGNDTTSGDTNVAVGYKASQKITTGFDNVMIGAEAGFTMTEGDANVGIGYRALYSSTVGFSSTISPNTSFRPGSVAGTYTNISLGNGLTLSSINIPAGENFPDDYNYGTITGITTAISFGVEIPASSLGGGGGVLQLSINVVIAGPGRRNTAIGYESLFANNLANENTAVGYESLRNTVEGYDNTAIGTFAMKNNVSGYQNVSLGYQALEGNSNSSGNNNVAIGLRTMQDITSGYQNVALGQLAGNDITSGYQNILLGSNSGNDITSGYQNILLGSNSGPRISTSYQNIAIGSNSITNLETNSDGYQNIGIGDNAFDQLEKGYQNVALGSTAGREFRGNTASLQNTLIGANSMKQVEVGSGNVCLGYNSGNFSSFAPSGTVNNSTYLGNDTEISASGVTNEIAIGYDAEGGGSNTIVLGNTSITALKCQVQTITSLSDKRDKTNIQDSKYGLDLISKLKPVTFDWNMRDGAKVGIKDLGFIAQDLQKVSDSHTQLVNDKNPEKLEASYGRLIPVLVKAIQDLKAELDNKQDK